MAEKDSFFIKIIQKYSIFYLESKSFLLGKEENKFLLDVIVRGCKGDLKDLHLLDNSEGICHSNCNCIRCRCPNK